MTDGCGRIINYLRLSITERCTLRCAYCRAGEGDCRKKHELSAELLVRITRIMAELGITKVRVTGGEPMLRRDLLKIIEGIRAIDSIHEINMTTNAQHLTGRVASLKVAGLDRLNISIDSLKEGRYADMTGGGCLQTALLGIDEALQAGFVPLKLNAVLIRGINDDEMADFIELTRDRPIDMRFIELMPFGSVEQNDRRVSGDEIRGAFPMLVPVNKRYDSQPANDYQIPGYIGRVGLIDAMSHRFCNNCNRIRVMSDGMLRPCLGQNAEVSLLQMLKQGDDAALAARIREAIYHKPAHHGFGEEFVSDKNMSRIGG